MTGQPDDRQEAGGGVARRSDAASDDMLATTTDENSDRSAQESLGGTAGPERTDEADDMQTG
jgi:hypothetical protein